MPMPTEHNACDPTTATVSKHSAQLVSIINEILTLRSL